MARHRLSCSFADSPLHGHGLLLSLKRLNFITSQVQT
jgi:hypothetical protein